MRRIVAAIALACTTTLPVFAQSTTPTPTSSSTSPETRPAAASSNGIVYVEHPDGGPDVSSGRMIPSSGGTLIHSLDINSSVDVKIDPYALAKSIAANGIGKFNDKQLVLLDRIRNLEATMAAVDVTARMTTEMVAKFGNVSDQEFDDDRSTRARLLIKINGSLRNVMADRLQESGMDASQAMTTARNAIHFVGTMEQWPSLRERIKTELAEGQAAYQAAAQENGAVAVEIQGHLLPKSGDPRAIPLPGYNSVQPGPLAHYEKIRYEVPSDQRALYDSYVKIQKETADAKNLSQAILASLRADYNVSPLKANVDLVQADAKSIQQLADAIDKKTIDAWLKSLAAKAATGNTPDAQLITSVTVLVNDLKARKNELDQLTNLSKFADKIKTESPPDALQQMLYLLQGLPLLTNFQPLKAEWNAVEADLKTVIAQTTASGVTAALSAALVAPDSPFAPLLGSDGALAKLRKDIDTLIATVKGYLDAQTTASNIVQLPVPEGQTRRDIAGSINTSFNLQTLPGSRNPGDTIRLSYNFYQGDQPIASPTWFDQFDIRVYGLSDKVLASLALVRQVSQETFKPTAAMSWLLHYNRWPTTADDSFRSGVSILSGAGLTTMALDFDATQSVELGIAPTVGLLNNRILLGYGWNLQVPKHRTFAFFSIQLLSRNGMLAGGQ